MHYLLQIVKVLVVVMVVAFTGCREQQLTMDENAGIVFSQDTVNFDTVLTSFGSSTRSVMVRNHNTNAVRIARVWWQNGNHFYANLDGENNTSHWEDITLLGGDSLFLFIRVEIDPYDTDAHPIEEDALCFEVNGKCYRLVVQAYGMDVECIRSKHLSSFYPDGLTLNANKPYLIYDTLWINGPLIIEQGATLYMHPTANIMAYGDVQAIGSANQPIRILGDRTDKLFPQVPYRVASGQWGGIYLCRLDSLCGAKSLKYDLEYIQLLSGQTGLYCSSDNKDMCANLHLHNARIHNMSACGLVVENTNAEISNVEISNCASYGVYLCGGTHRIEHSSIANYFGYPYTTLNIHSTTRKDVPALYIVAQAQDMATSVSSIYNSIITGAFKPALVIDSISEQGFEGQVAGCYLRLDSLSAPWAHNNTMGQDNDTVFMNIYYKYGEYIYYDFHLTEQSKARQIGLPLDSLKMDVHLDSDGKTRNPQHPDAGCYSFE